MSYLAPCENSERARVRTDVPITALGTMRAVFYRSMRGLLSPLQHFMHQVLQCRPESAIKHRILLSKAYLMPGQLTQR